MSAPEPRDPSNLDLPPAQHLARADALLVQAHTALAGANPRFLPRSRVAAGIDAALAHIRSALAQLPRS